MNTETKTKKCDCCWVIETYDGSSCCNDCLPHILDISKPWVEMLGAEKLNSIKLFGKR